MTKGADIVKRIPLILVTVSVLLFAVSGVAWAAAGDATVANYAQCASGQPPSTSTACPDGWIGGALNANNSHYIEDDAVPHRLVLDVPTGGSLTGRTVTFEYTSRKGSAAAHAYDSLATWNLTQTTANRCDGLAAADCPGGSANTFPIPNDPAVVCPATTPTSAHMIPAGSGRLMTMYGGTITGVSVPTHSNANPPGCSGDDDGSVTITYSVASLPAKVMILVGGHLAPGTGSRGWGAGTGAGSISGGPYHMKLTSADGSSVGSRDNQIQAGAVAPLVPTPVLAIAKTPDAGQVTAGGTASFTIQVTNNGPGTANSVTVSDTLPAGLTWTESSNACSIASGALSCNFGNLNQGQSASVTVSAPTDTSDCGALNNTATAGASNAASVSDSGSITVSCPVLAISKTPDAGQVTAGGTASFIIQVTNNGPGTATGVTLSDTLPTGLTWTENSTACSISAGVLSCSFGSLAQDASASVTISAPTDTGACRTLNNTATADATNAPSVSDNGSITVNCPVLAISKTPDAGQVNSGEIASFTIQVTNNGPGTATGVTVSDTLPSGLTWTEASTSCSITSGVLSCSFGDLAQGASASVTVTAVTDTGDCGTLNNTATADADNAAPVSDNGSITITCPPPPPPGTPVLTLAKTPDAGQVTAGNTATFTIQVTNNGPGTANNVTISDTLPSGLAWTDGSNSCSIASGVLSCSFGDLNQGQSASVTVSAPTDTGDCGTLNNTATADADNASPVSDSGLITVNCPAPPTPTPLPDLDPVPPTEVQGRDFDPAPKPKQLATTGSSANLPGMSAAGVTFLVGGVLLLLAQRRRQETLEAIEGTWVDIPSDGWSTQIPGTDLHSRAPPWHGFA
jgi:uncharacterized repeat protein (TIGR01451 family)